MKKWSFNHSISHSPSLFDLGTQRSHNEPACHSQEQFLILPIQIPCIYLVTHIFQFLRHAVGHDDV